MIGALIVAVVYLWCGGSLMYLMALRHANEKPNLRQWCECLLWPALIPVGLAWGVFNLVRSAL